MVVISVDAMAILLRMIWETSNVVFSTLMILDMGISLLRFCTGMNLISDFPEVNNVIVLLHFM